MKTQKARIVAIGLIALAGWSSGVFAGEAATISDFSSADTFAGYVSGWRFSVTKEFTITHLGVLDLDAPGLTSTHTVGLWKLPRTGGFQFICSVEIGDQQGELIGQHRYMPITPVTLVPDTAPPVQVGGYLYRDRYLLGVWSPVGSLDKIRLWSRAAVTISDIIRVGEAAPPEPGFASNYTAYMWKPQTTPPYTGLVPPWGAISSAEHYGVNFRYAVPGPQAEAGADMEIYTSQQATTVVAGTATHTKPGTAMTYQWLEDSTVLQSGTVDTLLGTANLDLATLTTALSVGSHTLTLDVTDGVYSASDTMTLTIANTPPDAQPSPTYQALEIGGDAILIAAEVADFDGDTISYQWLKGGEVLGSGTVTPPAGGGVVSILDLTVAAGDPRFPLGSNDVQLVVSDGVNPAETQTVTVLIQDTTAPSLAPTPSTALLWPANHEMVPVTIWTNTQDNGGGLILLDVSVQSSEPLDAAGDGSTEEDFAVASPDNAAGVVVVQLRAERSGTDVGRVYTVTIVATDGSGNQSTALVSVRVPHDRKKK